MRKVLLAVFLTVALPILFSGQQRANGPMASIAVACDMTSAGNFCVSESEPRHHLRNGNRNNSDRSVPLEASIASIALMLLIWAMRR
jgi:hypothetical protein